MVLGLHYTQGNWPFYILSDIPAQDLTDELSVFQVPRVYHILGFSRSKTEPGLCPLKHYRSGELKLFP